MTNATSKIKNGLLGLAFFSAALFAIKIYWQSPAALHADAALVRGQVFDGKNPIAGAIVRVPGQANSTLTDREGKFRLAKTAGDHLTITAWKEGFVIGGMNLGEEPTNIRLRKLPTKDHANYSWVDPRPESADKQRCGNCHLEIFKEWETSGHSQSATNPRFLDLFNGTDRHGNAKKSWSLRVEYPLGLAVCTSCHAPTATQEQSNDLSTLTGTARQGVHCDFCHKVQDVSITNLGLTHGRDAMSLLRPSQGQLFFGPLDDVNRDEDVFSPLQKDSRYCAACHEGVVFGVHVYSTFSEWQASAAARAGRSCQSCHMAATGHMTNIAPNSGGIERDPQTLASHSFSPGGREAMLKRCLDVKVTTRRRDRQPIVDVQITPRDVGHKVPTGFIDRHLILIVEPQSQSGESIPVEKAKENENPAASLEELAHHPGRFFGRLLTGEDGQSPVPFWRAPTKILDTRLSPDETTTSNFELPTSTEKVRVRLLYRRFWREVTQAKNWPDDTITVFDEVFSLEP